MIKYKELEGQYFGNWKVIGDAHEHEYGYVRCVCINCNNEKDVNVSTLRLGKTHGCIKCADRPIPSLNNKAFKIAQEYIGQEINGLKILDVRQVESKNKTKKYEFKCKCTCDEEFWTKKDGILHGGIKSCGHDRGEILEAGRKVGLESYVDGTCINAIKNNRKNNINSTSGIKGVSYMKHSSKYRAYISFKRQFYHLGSFDTVEEAAEARKIAESKIFGEFLEWYENEGYK